MACTLVLALATFAYREKETAAVGSEALCLADGQTRVRVSSTPLTGTVDRRYHPVELPDVDEFFLFPCLATWWILEEEKSIVPVLFLHGPSHELLERFLQKSTAFEDLTALGRRPVEIASELVPQGARKAKREGQRRLEKVREG